MTQDKRQLLVQTALRLFYDRGIHAVGINEILASAGVAKKTLYNHFDSKDKLIEAAVELRDQRFMKWFNNALDQHEPGEQALIHMFNALDDWFNERVPQLTPFKGCFFINASAEFKGPDCQIYNLCQLHKKSVREALYPHCLETTQSIDLANKLADQTLLLKEGAIISAHVVGDRNAAKTAQQMMAQLIATFKKV